MPPTEPGGTQGTAPSVCVVGGGIVGLASAERLAQAGADVTVLEQGSIGNGSTGLAAGGIRTQYNRPADIQMMQASVAVWEQFAETHGEEIGYQQHGYLMAIRDDETLEAMDDAVMLQREQGLDTRLVSPREAKDICPQLAHSAYQACTYNPMDGYADPHLALMGYKRAAQAAGATIQTNTPVESITTDGTGTITGVRTADEELAADVVVNAAGAWAAELAATAGIQLPIEPKPRRAATVAPTHEPDVDLPLVVDLDSGVYFRPFDDDQLLVGGHFETVTTDGESDPTVEPEPRPNGQAPLDWQATVLERAVDCAGYFGPDSTITGSWEGRYAMTPDENPIIERTAPGLVTAAGFSGHGLMMAPATGQVVADLITTGRTEVADIQAYSSDRFEKRDSRATNDDSDQEQITF